MKIFHMNWLSFSACIAITIIVGVSVSGASGINSITVSEGTTAVPSGESALDDSSKPQFYSEDEGLAEIRKLLVCQDKDINFLRKEQILDEYLYEYESDETNYLFDPNRGVLVGIIKLEYNMSGSDISDESSISKAEKYVSEYFPDLDLSKMELTVNELIDHGSFQDRSIEFRKLTDGVDTGNSIMIRLTSGGDLISVMLCYNDELALQQVVNFDTEKAIEIACAKVKEDMVANGRETYVKDAADYEYEIRKTVFRDNLVWLIKVNGVSLFGSGDDANSDSTYTVIITCESGEVVLFDSTFYTGCQPVARLITDFSLHCPETQCPAVIRLSKSWCTRPALPRSAFDKSLYNRLQ